MISTARSLPPASLSFVQIDEAAVLPESVPLLEELIMAKGPNRGLLKYQGCSRSDAAMISAEPRPVIT